jgi:PQQ-dependent catabolism-associated CXXCW motif protein
MADRTIAVALAGALLLATPALADAPAAPAEAPVLFDPQGYRTARYRAPVTADPAPARRIALAAALALEPGRDALFIDVMPAEGGVRDAASGAWALARPHQTIPGAVWHPEAGRMPADPALWQALETAARVAAPARPVILLCRIDCWMSWNAARRLAAGGLGNVFWLAEGTDGWHGAGRDLAVAAPVAVPQYPADNKEH